VELPPNTPPERAYETLRKLQLVTEAALSALDLEGLFDELLLRTRDVLEADTCAILLLDPATDELVARAAKGIEEEVEAGVRIPLGKGFAGRIAAYRHPVVLPDVDHADVLNPILREKGIKSLLGAPLISRERVLGVIHVGTLTPRDFTEEDVELLELVAQRVAQGLERALVHDELVHVEELQRRFVALASHELRTPAAAVYGAAATLRHRRDILSPEIVDQLIDVLFLQSERLARLTEQLLDLSRLDASRVRIHVQPTDVRTQLEALIRSLDATQPESVELDVPRNLTIETDRDALDHIVTNLLTNAFRYGEAPVRVEANAEDTHFRLAVEDSGEGVAREFVPRLFERFTRSDEASSKTGGSGLGLAIAQSYANAHGGELLYEPAEPKGARFELVLPRPHS
jgi:signal transduction histidine kinase